MYSWTGMKNTNDALDSLQKGCTLALEIDKGPIVKKKKKIIRYGFSLVWFLVLILIRAILEQSMNNKMVSKT